MKMEQHKIENFEREEGKNFPSFRELEKEECKKIYHCVAKKLNLPEDVSDLDLVKKLDSIGVFVDGVNAEDEDFNLIELLKKKQIREPREVFINWYRFDAIDAMNLDDVVKYFSDIWYPGSDDIDIFDETLTWFISVRHDGIIKIAKV